MLAYGLYPSVLLFEQDWLTPALSNVLVVFGVLGLIHKKTWSLALGAFSLGCAISVHPSLLLLGLVSLFWGWKDSHLRWPILLGLCLALSPTVVWNAKMALLHWYHITGINPYMAMQKLNNTALRPGLEFAKLCRLSLQKVAERKYSGKRNTRGRPFKSSKQCRRYLTKILVVSQYWDPRNEDYRCRRDEPILQPLRWNPIDLASFSHWVFGHLQCRKSVKESPASHLPFFGWPPIYHDHILCLRSLSVATVPFWLFVRLGLLSLWKNLERDCPLYWVWWLQWWSWDPLIQG